MIYSFFNGDTKSGNKKSVYTYDANHNMVLEMVYRNSNNAWAIDKKIEYTYDANGNVIGKYTQQWKNDAWQDNTKEEYVYDDGNRLNIDSFLICENEIWKVRNYDIYTYDANGNLTEYKYCGYLKSVPLERFAYTYDENGKMLTQTKFGSGDEPRDRWVYIYNGNLCEYDTSYTWTIFEEVWEMPMLSEYTYDEQGRLVCKITYRVSDDELDPEVKYTYEYDAEGRQIRTAKYNYYDYNEEWHGVEKEETTYDENGNLICWMSYYYDEDWVKDAIKEYFYHEETPTAVFEVANPNNTTKYLRQGQVVILRNGVKFNALGQIVE